MIKSKIIGLKRKLIKLKGTDLHFSLMYIMETIFKSRVVFLLIIVHIRPKIH